MSRLVDYSIVSRFDYSTCRVAFSQLQYVACRFLSITVCVVSRFVDYSTFRVGIQNHAEAFSPRFRFRFRVAFCRLQYLSCRFLSIALCVMSRLVDYSTCRVAFSRLRYVSMIPCRVYCIVDYITCRVAFSHRQRFRFSERPTFEPRRRVVSVTDFGYSFEIQQALDKRTPSLPPYGT